MEQEDLKQEKSIVAKDEEAVLKFWQDNNIFEKSLEKESPKGSFVFYDGPPFATGTPHYGHILPGTIKDVIPRFQTMKGKKVLRRWGWDCHGLPLENLIEKELNLKTKKEILDYGIDKFNKKARDGVLKYAHIWKDVISRSGRFVDMEDDYRTMDKTYTESVWWSFKNLYERGLIYKGFKSMHLCPRCETTLSNFEVNLGYKDITDISVIVGFEILDLSKDLTKTVLLVWTTTPWTLPGNVALAINENIEYVEVSGHIEGNKYILAKSMVEKVFKENFKILRTVPVKEILGKKYKPLFDYYSNDESLKDKENGWKVYSGDFVTSEEGTGIVHIAPAFGNDDYSLLKKYNLPFVQHVRPDGTFEKEVSDFAGLHAKPKSDEKDGHQKTDIEIIKYLAHNDLLFAKEKITHSYPHCWRCDSPLLNYASSSWFVKIESLKSEILNENKKVNWVPKEIGENRFGNWIEGAPDWAISRSRFWGAPIPVWHMKDGSVFVPGGVSELKKYIPKRNDYFLMRHGESQFNAKGDMISSLENNIDSLTDLGKDEVVRAANFLKGHKIDVIISSPFIRTRESAEEIAKETSFDGEIIFDKRLSELGAFDFNGKKWSEYLKNFDTVKDRFEKKVLQNENWEDVRRRVAEFIYDIDSKYEGKNILIVSHGAPLRILDLISKGFSIREMEKHYNDDSFYNAEIIQMDFRQFPKNENFEIDLHKPFIDDLVLLDEKGERLERVKDVFDCWYESGSMFFAQHHYPFENKEEFEKENSVIFPADFVAEGLDQTRGWFYTLIVLGTALFGKSPYKNVLVNGLVLAEDGRKMSKKLKNYPEISYIFDKYGVDSLRYLLISTPLVRAEDFSFKENSVSEIYKKIILKMKNVISFFEMYSLEASQGEIDLNTNVLDRWIFARLLELEENINKYMESFELDRATRPIIDFVDDFSSWFLRRSRERFRDQNVLLRDNAIRNTSFIICEFAKLIAPFMPFLAENLYQKFKRIEGGMAKESVHLCSWPEYSKIKYNSEIISSMKEAREAVSLILESRQKFNIKVRQPIANVRLKNKNLFKDLDILEIIKEEVNAKEIIFDENISENILIDHNITEDLLSEGVVREFIRMVQDARKEKGFKPKDMLNISVKAEGKILDIISSHKEKILKSIGALDIKIVNSEDLFFKEKLAGLDISFSLI